jgi:putative flippase GtrA
MESSKKVNFCKYYLVGGIATIIAYGICIIINPMRSYSLKWPFIKLSALQIISAF